MTNKILRITKIIAFIMLLVLVLMACNPSSEVSVEDAVKQTVDARDALALQVQQTGTAQALQVQQTVEAQMTALQLSAEVPAGGDVADPNANVPVSQPVVDPNLAGGTPQLRVTLSSVNVRSGPGTNYPPITTLRQDAVVVAAAKNQAGTWFLIDLPGGVKGWISNTVTTPVVEADMVKVPIAATIPAPPQAVVPATATTAAATPTTAAAATTASPTTAAATHTPQATTAAATAAPTETATTPPTTPTQLTKSSWQVDFLFLGGSDRLQVEFNQTGNVLSGSNRDNNAELDIVTTGTVTGDTVVVTFTLSNGGSPRGSATCTGTINEGPPQTISGTFMADDGTSGSCDLR
jgi:hypothetical protein